MTNRFCGPISNTARNDFSSSGAQLLFGHRIRNTEGARPALVDLNRLSDEQIMQLEQELHDWRQNTAQRGTVSD